MRDAMMYALLALAMGWGTVGWIVADREHQQAAKYAYALSDEQHVAVGFGCATPTSVAVAAEEDQLPASCVEVEGHAYRR